MMHLYEHLQKKLSERENQNALRSLKIVTPNFIDFSSNDYLGIVKNKLCTIPAHLPSGATGSRLLSGNNEQTEMLEAKIAHLHHAEAALLFNSGYDANVGLLSAVLQKDDVVLYDYLSHASLRDGIRLSYAQSFSFEHNSIPSLLKKIEHAKKELKGSIYIVTESVFSMDGDKAPLKELIAVCQLHGAFLIVDEAHATGLCGPKGEGLCVEEMIEEAVFARIVTFGKAVGCHGAAVLGGITLINYLINFARTVIYSTALPQHSIAAIDCSYNLFPEMHQERSQLKKLIQYFNNINIPFTKLSSHTPIQAIIIPGNSAVKRIAAFLQEKHIDARPILYPTVPKQTERLRIVLHSYNTIDELNTLSICLNEAYTVC
ncbi:MAG: aminotransferase class I/II-fold pyridoxal phosphate-dependent enzyme [Chitinophagaceae bacterium]